MMISWLWFIKSLKSNYIALKTLISEMNNKFGSINVKLAFECLDKYELWDDEYLIAYFYSGDNLSKYLIYNKL